MFEYPHLSSTSTNLPSFIKLLGRIKESKKISAYCTSNDIKASNKQKKNFELIDLQSCDNSLDVIISTLPKILSDSPSCFVVLIRSNVTDDNFETKLRDVLEERVVRPVVVNFYSRFERNESIYVVDRSKTRTQTNKSLEFAKEFIDTILSYDYDVEGLEFSRNRSKILKTAMVNGCSMCINFANLIDYRFLWYLKIHENEIDSLKCDSDCFKAILRFPHDFDFNSSYENLYELLYSYYIELMRESATYASSIGDNYSVREYLKDHEYSLDLDGLSALAWKEEEYQVFEFLIRADLSFPQNFLHDRANELSYGVNRNKFIKNVESYIEELENFHRYIRKGNLKRVQTFLTKNQHLTFARNLDNKSALKVAFENSQLEILSYLRSQGMNFGGFKEVGEYFKARNKFGDNKKKQLRQFNRKFLTPAIEVDLITKLMQKSSFAFDHHVHKEKDIQYVIKRSYEKIQYLMPEILEIAAGSNELQINFDFTNSDLVEFDPYINDAYGAAYSYYDFVIIAAKDLLSDDIDKKNYALGTLAHELMHYTMHQIYQNSIEPYDERDFERKEIIKKIYKKYRSIKNKETLISTAYKHDDEEDNYGELIARVPDIIFTYKDNETYLEEVKETFKDLFKFYDQYVLADMQEFIPTIHIREKVRELNGWLDLVAEIETYDFEHTTEEEETETDDDDDDIDEESENKIDDKKEDAKKEEQPDDEEELPEVNAIEEFLNENTSQRLKVFTSSSPKLILQKLYYRLRKSKKLAIYVASSFSYYGNFEQVMYKIDTIHPSVPLIINCDRVKRLNKFVKMMQKTTFRKVVAIADKEEFDKRVKLERYDEWIEKSEF